MILVAYFALKMLSQVEEGELFKFENEATKKALIKVR